MSEISIHTPTQGVTDAVELGELVEVISIHTPTQGVTKLGDAVKEFNINFNPHSHAGSDLSCVSTPQVRTNFNPHSHAGSDLSGIWDLNGNVWISIHTPTQGVTLRVWCVVLPVG